ncbi:MAG: efflux RND transporter permease subunit, partial [Treponema sp.]|nr:efflux RND transporter permease subunit [Treponema sp.]
EFAYGTDMDKAANDAQILVNRIANSLPEGVQTPIVRRFDMSATPVMRLIVRGNYPPDQLRIFAEDEIQSSIERVEGVASAEVTGGTTQIVKVAVSLNRLAAFNLTLNDISNALRGQSVLASGGNLRRGTREYQIMTQEELVSVEQIKRLVVKTVNLSPAGSAQPSRSQVVRIEDVADVSLGYNENAARVTINGQSGVYIQVTSESGTNQVKVSDGVRAALIDINEALPPGLTLEILSDNTNMIRATLKQVYANGLQGAGLAMLILLLFLRNIKGTLIIGLAIPISMSLTLMAMSIFGFTLNLLTMTGLIMGLGMTLDGSIVILENVYNYRQRGAKAPIAAILGSREMTRAIVTATITTLCVFIPLIIYKNDLQEMGQLFNDLIFTVVISLSTSLLVAITLVPSLCGSIIRLDTRVQKPLKNRLLKKIDNAMERFFKSLDNGYRNALDYCLSHRTIVLSLVMLILVFSLMQFGGIGMNLFTRIRTDDNVNINITMPPGTAIDVTEEMLFGIEEVIKQEVRGYQHIILTARRSGANQGNIQIVLPEPGRQLDTPDSIIRKMTPILSQIPGIRFNFRAGRGMTTTSAIEIAVSSRNYNAIMDTANEILGIIERHLPEIENPAINIDEGAPQLQIEIDRDRAASFGLSLTAIASEIRTAMDGYTSTTMSRGDRLINVQVQLRDEDRQGLPNLDAIFVMSRNGNRVSLSNVANIVEGRAPTSIRREKQERVVRVTGDLGPGIAATEMQRRLEEAVNHNLVPREGVRVRFLGEAHEIQAYYLRYLLIIGTAVFLIFGITASQFESFVDPLIIFFSIPLLFIGVIWIYKIGGQDMSMFSAVGVVALVGVVINNGIVLVDYTNTLRSRGLPLREACLEAGRSRLRPILMTSLSTILAMIPIAFFPGAGAATIQPIGQTFVGGLTISSFMTLFVTPVMYSILNTRSEKKKLAKMNMEVIT